MKHWSKNGSVCSTSSSSVEISSHLHFLFNSSFKEHHHRIVACRNRRGHSVDLFLHHLQLKYSDQIWCDTTETDIWTRFLHPHWIGLVWLWEWSHQGKYGGGIWACNYKSSCQHFGSCPLWKTVTSHYLISLALLQLCFTDLLTEEIVELVKLTTVIWVFL